MTWVTREMAKKNKTLEQKLIDLITNAECYFSTEMVDGIDHLTSSSDLKPDQDSVTRAHNKGFSMGLRAGYLDAAQYLCWALQGLIGDDHNCPVHQGEDNG